MQIQSTRIPGRSARALALLAALAIAAAPIAARAGFEDLEKQVTSFTLDNGLTFIVVERHTAPVFSFTTQVDAGAVDEVPGYTGVAHMFEHMAFKGTKIVGVTDPDAEAQALARVDDAFASWLDERRRGPRADPEKLATLRADLDEAIAAAQDYVISNDFTKILEENGGVGINAQTGVDFTRYFYSLPSNRLELWAALESDRLANPVLREFETERNVVIEERRMSFESTPIGRLQNAFMAMAFPAHPYGDGIIGHTSDLETFTREDAWEFFRTYYVAPNMTVVVVGDVETGEVKKLAKKYFEEIPTGPEPGPVDTIEPPQVGERRITIEDSSQPIILLGYPIPASRHPDYPAFDLLGAALGQGRSSRLYETFVKKRPLAAQIIAATGFPGEKYANLLVTFALVSAGQDPRELESSILQLLEEDLRETPITQEELDGARARLKASLIRGVRTNMGLAQNLAIAEELYGGWRMLFELPARYEAVTVEDVKRIADETFQRKNRNVGIIVPPQES